MGKPTAEPLQRLVEADLLLVFVPVAKVMRYQQLTLPRIKVGLPSELYCGFVEPFRVAMLALGDSGRFGWDLRHPYQFEAY